MSINASIKRMGLEGISKKDLFGIDPRLLEVEEGFNLRFDLDRSHIDAFKATLRAGGTIPPLEVRGTPEKRIFVVDGHHRRQAIIELLTEGVEILRVDCFASQGGDADRVATMLTSSQGKPLTPLEQAFGYQRLQRFGWTTKEIADRVGRTTVRVDQLLGLACADSTIHLLIREGKVSADLAIEVIGKHGSGAGPALSALVEKASAAGKPKVTRKTIVGRAPSKKVVTSVFERLSDAAALVPADTLAVIAKAKDMPEGERTKVTVMVPVDVLIGLVDAGGLIAGAAKNPAPTMAQDAASRAA